MKSNGTFIGGNTSGVLFFLKKFVNLVLNVVGLSFTFEVKLSLSLSVLCTLLKQSLK